MTDQTNRPDDQLNEAPIDESDLDVDEERQIIIHCTNDLRDALGSRIRFCPPIYLMDPITGYKSNLLFAYNIALKPDWTYIPPGHSSWKFTLIFGGLPQGCQEFDLIEVESGFGILDIEGITRNKEDIYHVIID